jgi:hypothetical protein
MSADGIRVYSAHDKLARPADLETYPNNPNEHPPEQLRLYLKILRENGWRRSVVVSNRSGYVTKGNGAVLAARLGKLKEIPVEYQDYASDEAEWEDLVADNELARLANRNEAALKEILGQLQTRGRDPELAGILKKLEEPVELKAVAIVPPPKMAWVLIGIPLVQYAKITAAIEKISLVKDALVESTFNDDTQEKLTPNG